MIPYAPLCQYSKGPAARAPLKYVGGLKMNDADDEAPSTDSNEFLYDIAGCVAVTLASVV